MAVPKTSDHQVPKKRVKGHLSKASLKSTEVKLLLPKSFYDKHEVPRKLLHSLTGGITLFGYAIGLQIDDFLLPFALLSAGFLVLELVRFRVPWLNDILTQHFKIIMRPSEKYEYNGVIFFQLGLLFLFLVFPKDICVMGALFLSWGDTFASFIGREFGKYTPKISDRKSIAGCIGSFLMGAFCCYIFYGLMVPHCLARVDIPGQFWWTPQSSLLNIHAYALICGVICSMSEALELYNLDDNLTIPVMGGSLLYCLVSLFRI